MIIFDMIFARLAGMGWFSAILEVMAVVAALTLAVGLIAGIVQLVKHFRS